MHFEPILYGLLMGLLSYIAILLTSVSRSLAEHQQKEK